MASAASSPHIIMALQSSKEQQKSLVLWTSWQLSVACSLFCISKTLDAFSRAVGRGGSSRTVLRTIAVSSQVGAQLREGPARGKMKNPWSQSSTTLVIPRAKVVWQYEVPFLGLSICLERFGKVLPVQYRDGPQPLMGLVCGATALAWRWPWHPDPCGRNTSTSSRATSVLGKLFGNRILCRFSCSSSSCVVCFWKQYV